MSNQKETPKNQIIEHRQTCNKSIQHCRLYKYKDQGNQAPLIDNMLIYWPLKMSVVRPMELSNSFRQLGL